MRRHGGGGLVAKSCRMVCNPWTVDLQAPLSRGFSRQEYWSGLPCPPPGDLPDPGIEPRSPTLQTGYSPAEPLRRHKRHRFDRWVRKIPWRRAWQPTPVFLPGESHGQRSLGATAHGAAESQTRLSAHTLSLPEDSPEFCLTPFAGGVTSPPFLFHVVNADLF